MAGLLLVGLSLVTYLGGGVLVGSWLAAVQPSGVRIYVADAETCQHLARELVTVTVTHCSYMGYTVPLNVVLKVSKTTPAYWSFSASLYTGYGVSVTATGYLTQVGTVSMPQNFIAEYTYRLSPEPQPGDPEPEPLPPEEPPVEVPEVAAEVYVNDVKVAPGDTVTVDTLDFVIRAVVTEGASSVQQLYGFVDEERLIFDVNEDWTEFTATYRLPGDGEYDINVRVLDKAGRDTLVASFGAVRGGGWIPELDPVDEAMKEALTGGTTLLSAALACLGAGLILLGGVKEEKRL